MKKQTSLDETNIIVPDINFQIALAEKMKKKNVTKNSLGKILEVLSVLHSHGGKTCRHFIMEVIYERCFDLSQVTMDSRNVQVSRVLLKLRKNLALINCDLYVGPKKDGPDAKVAVIKGKGYVKPPPPYWAMMKEPKLQGIIDDRKKDLALINIH